MLFIDEVGLLVEERRKCSAVGRMRNCFLKKSLPRFSWERLRADTLIWQLSHWRRKTKKILRAFYFLCRTPFRRFSKRLQWIYKLLVHYFWLLDWCYFGHDTMLCLHHKVEKFFIQLHMKNSAEERNEIGVEDHVISFYPHRTLRDW